MLNAVCLYCGSSDGNDAGYAALAERLGRLLAERGIRLVYGGGSIGLMGVAARAALKAGGHVIGVIPEDLVRREVALHSVTTLEVTPDMHARKRMMFDLSDGFVVLPGGMGTLDETVEMITWRQLGIHEKPIALVDNNGYWDPFVEMLRHMIDKGFAPSAGASTYFFRATSPEEALDGLARRLDGKDGGR